MGLVQVTAYCLVGQVVVGRSFLYIASMAPTLLSDSRLDNNAISMGAVPPTGACARYAQLSTRREWGPLSMVEKRSAW